MKIKILGTRGEIEASAPYHSRHSGVLINDELMLDLGEREFLEYGPKMIFFTHLHPDHAFFIRRSEQADIDISMYAPESYRNDGIKILKYDSKRKIDGYDIRPIPTIHSQKVESQAYLVSRGSKKLLYTGDMVWIKRWYNRYFKDLDLVITEASFIRESGMIQRHKESGKIYGHAGIPRLVKYFSEFCRRIVLIHYGSWFYKDSKKARRRLREIARKYNVRVEAGYDGMELEL